MTKCMLTAEELKRQLLWLSLEVLTR
jgi:hypothetical protein